MDAHPRIVCRHSYAFALSAFLGTILWALETSSQTVAPETFPSEAFPRVPEVRTAPERAVEAPVPIPGLAVPDQGVPAGAESVIFVLNEIRIEGGTAYPAAQIEPFYRGLIGTRVSLEQLFGVAAAIE